MPQTEKFSISLPLELAKMVRKRVNSGAYASNSEVIRNALRSLQHEENKEMSKLAELKSDIEDGIASGDAGVLNFEELKTLATKNLKDNLGR